MWVYLFGSGQQQDEIAQQSEKQCDEQGVEQGDEDVDECEDAQHSRQCLQQHQDEGGHPAVFEYSVLAVILQDMDQDDEDPYYDDSCKHPVAHLHPLIEVPRPQLARSAMRPAEAGKGGVGMSDEGATVHHEIDVDGQEYRMVSQVGSDYELLCLKLLVDFEDEQCKKEDGSETDQRNAEMRRENEIVLSPHDCCRTDKCLCEYEADAGCDEKERFPLMGEQLECKPADQAYKYDGEP